MVNEDRMLVLLDIVAWLIYILFQGRIVVGLELEVLAIPIMQLFDEHLIHKG